MRLAQLSSNDLNEYLHTATALNSAGWTSGDLVLTVNLFGLLKKRIRLSHWIVLVSSSAYVLLTFVIFFYFVVPSFANDSTSEEFAVDTTVYVYYADSVREGRNDPTVIGPLLSFPNTLVAPVCMSLLLNNHFMEMLANYAMFGISLILLKRSLPISLCVFIPLMIVNPVTTTSILCINKEVLDMLALSLFLYTRVHRNRALLLFALALALFNRYEICVVMLAFLIAGSKLNPWRERRLQTVLILVVALNFIMPFFGGTILAKRFEEAQNGRFIAPLDVLQMHYLYILVVIPKIAINLFGELLNPFVWKDLNSWTYIMFFNNLSYVFVLLIAAKKHLLKLNNDIIYLGVIGAVLVAQSIVVQPRYFYFLYILLCLQIANRDGGGINLLRRSRISGQNLDMLGRAEVALG